MPTIARKYPHFRKVKHILTFVSLGIPGLYYLAPLLCSEKWRSINLMPKLTRLPILFLAGERDEVIPAIHMQQLYASAEKAEKGSYHNTSANYRMEVLALRNA
jgi:fermentation-respiration switch protein FrsA (DUF1100 family)